MKRFWHTFLALVATAALANTANAQWSPSGEIGSYQSILSRSGYSGGQASGSFTAAQAPVQSSPGAPMTYGNTGGYGGVGGYAQGGGYGYNAGNYGGVGYGQAYSGGPMQGGVVGGGITNGGIPSAPVQGGVTGGGIVNGGVVGNVNGGIVGAPPMATGIPQGVAGGYAGNIDGGVVVDRGYVGAPVQPFNQAPAYSAPAYSAPVYSAPVYAAPTYQIEPVYVAGQSFAPQVQRPASNLVFGLFGVNFRRDFEDGRKLGYSPAGDFFSDDVDHGNINGFGASLAKRGANGRGWEMRYWGLDETTDVDIAGATTTFLTGFSSIQHVPSGANVYAIYNQGESVRLSRSTEINSLEFNLLQNGGSFHTRHGKYGNYEMYGGFRLFQFDEDFRYYSDTTFAGYPTRLEYASETENLLTGFQIGARNEVCLSKKLRISKGFNVGIFNNRINTRQRIFDETGYNPLIGSGPFTGTPYSFEDEKNDVAFLGQLQLGLIYQLSKKSRIRAGYQALGVSGVALAADQIPYDFTDVDRIQSANSNGSLLLHGFFYGAEFCF